jgi:hypothetical protein
MGFFKNRKEGSNLLKMRFTKWDLIPIAMVVILAVAVFLLFLPSDAPAKYVEVYRNGVLLERFPLNRDRTFFVEGDYTNVITVSNERVAVTESDCPGGDCKNCGWLSSAGSIVCLPNAVEVRLITGDDHVDIVVG